MTIKPVSLKRSLAVLVFLFPTFVLGSDVPSQTSEWLPAGIEQLGKNAELHTDFTFDKTMIQMSSGFVGGDEDTRNAIAKLNGITVHLYRYSAPGMYDARQLDAIRAQYHSAGWKHLVSTQSAGGNGAAGSTAPIPPGSYATPPAPYVVPPDVQAHTDLFIKFQGTDVIGMVVMQSSARNLNVVAISGDLSPLDLLHLRGHFGIPKFAGDGFTPADN